MTSFLTRVHLCTGEGGGHLKDIVHKKWKYVKKKLSTIVNCDVLKLVSITFSKMLFLFIISSLFLPHSVYRIPRKHKPEKAVSTDFILFPNWRGKSALIRFHWRETLDHVEMSNEDKASLMSHTTNSIWKEEGRVADVFNKNSVTSGHTAPLYKCVFSFPTFPGATVSL